MRNIQEHPITTEEIIQCLDDVIASLNHGVESGSSPIGDMRPLLLDAAKKIVLASAATPAVGGEAIAWRVSAGNNTERHLFENKRDAQLMRDELEENGWLDVILAPLYAAQPASPLRGREWEPPTPSGLIVDKNSSSGFRIGSASPPEQPAAAQAEEISMVSTSKK